MVGHNHSIWRNYTEFRRRGKHFSTLHVLEDLPIIVGLQSTERPPSL